MPAIDSELIKYFNLLADSPSFAIRIDAKTHKSTLSNPTQIPDSDGEYLVHGITVTACGTEIVSVFMVNTNSGGTIQAVYWRAHARWIDSQDERVSTFLNIERDDIFPFDWKFSIPLENDIFHPTAG